MTATILIWLAGLVGILMGGQSARRCDAPEVLTAAPAFVECARAGTERYRDRSNAIADGYRLVGSDFPAMGEHWIRISSLFDGRFDAGRPEVLNYVSVEGEPRLLGVGYAVPLLEGENPPRGPAGPDAWHDHTRSITDETVLPHHHAAGNTTAGPRLAMMHAWIWAVNSEGTFAADNWALPFLRLGLEPAPNAPAGAARALSLASGGASYFIRSIAAATERHDTTELPAAFQRAEEAVKDLLQGNQGPKLTDAQLSKLADTWRGLWLQIDRSLSDVERARLAHLPIR
jgi:hypothetical protein